MPRYRLTYVPERFHPDVEPGERDFEQLTDEQAIAQSEWLTGNINFVIPNGGGTLATFPRELIELAEPPRVVKQW